MTPPPEIGTIFGFPEGKQLDSSSATMPFFLRKMAGGVMTPPYTITAGHIDTQEVIS